MNIQSIKKRLKKLENRYTGVRFAPVSTEAERQALLNKNYNGIIFHFNVGTKK